MLAPVPPAFIAPLLKYVLIPPYPFVITGECASLTAIIPVFLYLKLTILVAPNSFYPLLLLLPNPLAPHTSL